MEQQITSNSVNQEEFISRKRILLADDHAEMLDEVSSLLGGEYEIVGTAQDGKSLVEAAKELKPDLIVSDISMPEMTGFEAAAKIRALGMEVKLIFLTVQSSAGYLRKARSLGADGYVLKVYTTEQLRTAVASVFSGTPYFSPQLASSELM